MKRRNFIGLAGTVGGLLSTFPNTLFGNDKLIYDKYGKRSDRQELTADVVIAGGGLGGVAAALSALRNGLRVILAEETDWIGGQLTQQGVPPDEHRWIESHGATKSYRDF
ncbi:FAD-dependent oxidoreductase, partial [Parapusillimonas sp. SGNA-6]|nr:FAD-dependent oxidoreductase [Parapusillimonas sp. SGNA-6]